MIVTVTPQEAIHLVWPKVAEMLKAATDLSKTYGVADVLEGLFAGEYLLWLVLDGDTVVASFTTRCAQYPKGKSLMIDWIGGTRMDEWFDVAMEHVEAHARRNGCSRIEVFGRFGWKKVFEKIGGTMIAAVYEKEL